MNTLYIGIDTGYRNFDSVSQHDIISIPSVVSYYEQQEAGFNSGIIYAGNADKNQYLQAIVGNIAIKQGHDPQLDLHANKNIQDNKLSSKLLALTFHAIRAHISQNEGECEVNLCFAVPRAEYTQKLDNYGKLWSPEEKIFQRELDGEWRVWNEGGRLCNIHINNVLVRPQPEMAIRNQILNYDKEADCFLEYDDSWLYNRSRIPSTIHWDRLTEDQRAEYAVSTIVFDIGSYTSHAERLCVVGGFFQVTASKYADIGMWTLLPDIEKIIYENTGLNHLKPFELMRIFEHGYYGNVQLDSHFRAMLQTHWPKYEGLFKSCFNNYTEFQRVLLSGRGWHKYADWFRSKWGPVGEKYGFSIHSGNYGSDVAEGAFKTVRAKYGEKS